MSPRARTACLPMNRRSVNVATGSWEPQRQGMWTYTWIYLSSFSLYTVLSTGSSFNGLVRGIKINRLLINQSRTFASSAIKCHKLILQQRQQIITNRRSLVHNNNWLQLHDLMFVHFKQVIFSSSWREVDWTNAFIARNSHQQNWRQNKISS